MTKSHLDPSLAIAARVELLLAEMTIEEKVGQLFHTMAVVGPKGTLLDADFLSLPPQRELATDRFISHFNMIGGGTASELATWHNTLQHLALETRLQIPITISTDPRHSFTRNVGTGQSTNAFSSWPEALGLAAIGTEAAVERFAEVCRQDYLALGIRVALHPQLDLATEPRWARTGTTFGEDPELVARLGAAYTRGLLGADFNGPDLSNGGLNHGSVAVMIKHFPGGGPLKDGEDSHFPTGKQQIYPGGHFDTHLEPFRSAIAAGASQVMPSYGVPIGTAYDEVAFGFNHSVLTGILRDELGFDGIVCTDWGMISDVVYFGQDMPARAWGMEDRTPAERALAVLDAGADQFGGEHCTELILDLVESGAVAEGRIDTSVRRVLKDKFTLGLFEQRHVDVETAASSCGTAAQRQAGHEAQAQSVTVLTNNEAPSPTLPLPADCRVHPIGLDPVALDGFAVAVGSDSQADVNILRIHAAFEPRSGAFESMFHAGSLEYSDDELERFLAIICSRPTVVVVNLDRPCVLTPLVTDAAALVVEYGCSDQALVDALFGRINPIGNLPVDLPRSMAAVEASHTDQPCATGDPLFPLGHGLRLAANEAGRS